MVDEVRDTIQSLWVGVCNIFKYEEAVDKYGITENEKLVKLYGNVKCRLSFKYISQTNQTESFAETKQVVKLFIAPELYIPPGSVIEVTQNGITKKYKHSGEPAVYTHHQEIILDEYKERS